MTQGRVVLKALIASRELREICKLIGISYKFCWAVAEGTKKPSFDLMKQFRFMIPLPYWFDEASAEFINSIRNSIEGKS